MLLATLLLAAIAGRVVDSQWAMANFASMGDHRVYVDSAPHFFANAALTMAARRGWCGSLWMRAINHYRLDGDDPSIVASGHTVFDLDLAKQVLGGIELHRSLDNLTNRDYYETQNYFESRVTPLARIVARIYATPGYLLTAVAGVPFGENRTRKDAHS